MPANLGDMTPAELRAFRLGSELVKNPEVYREGQRLAKKANPALQIPEIELEDKLAAQHEAHEAEVEKLRQRQRESEARERRRDEHERIRAEGLEPSEVEDIVVAEKCTFATAMKLAKANARSAEPTASDYRGAQHSPIEMRPAEDWRKAGAAGLGGLRKRSAEVAAEMIDAARGRRPV